MTPETDTYRVAVMFPAGTTRESAFVRARSRDHAKHWAQDHWDGPVGIEGVSQREPSENAEVHDATEDSL